MLSVSGRVLPVFSAICLLVASSCGKDQSQGAQQAARPPQSYQVLEVSTTNTVLSNDYPTILKGTQDIDIRPKIDGYIDAIYVDEGAVVKKGQPLFRINNPQFLDQVRASSEAINAAEADVAAARLQVKKVEPLVKEDIISPYELESAQLTLKAREAQLAQAKANLANAKTNLGYTSVASPVSGVVGTIPHRLGSYVSSATTQPLTTVSDIANVFAYFSINEKEGMSLFNDLPGATFDQKIKQIPSVSLKLADGSDYAEKGKVETFSGQVNSQTGSFNVRASFPNSTGVLRSGASATIRIPEALTDVILIPQKATYELQGKRFVYVVGAEGEVKSKEVSVRPVPGGQLYVADSGLTSGEKIVIEGVGILTEGTKIVPVIAKADSVLNIK